MLRWLSRILIKSFNSNFGIIWEILIKSIKTLINLDDLNTIKSASWYLSIIRLIS